MEIRDAIILLSRQAGISGADVERLFGGDTPISAEVQTEFTRAINPDRIRSAVRLQEAALKASTSESE